MTHSRSQGAARAALHVGARPYGIDLAGPGGVEALLARHRAVFGDAVMEAGAGEAGAGAPAPAGEAGQTGATGAGQVSGEDGQGGDLGRAGGEQRVVAELAEQRQANRQLREQLDALRQADDTRRRADEAEATRRVRAELEAKVSEQTGAVGELRAQLVMRDARDAAVGAGVPPERWAAFSKHVDLTALTAQIGADGTVPADVLDAAVKAGLEEAPEFRTAATTRGRAPVAGSGAGAGRAHDSIDAATAAAVERMRRHLGHPVTDGAR